MGRRGGVADNPVLVGAGTILVILVMVMLSYNANEGLPFVPTYNISAEVPSGANVVKGNDVRVGGARVGLVSDITPKQRDGKYYAVLSMKLDQKYAEIPVDSKIEVRPRSTIGLKYVELTLGDSKEGLPDGGMLPLTQAAYATEFEDLLNTFDKRVREGNRRSLREFGNAFAGRGQDLNVAFGELPRLFENLYPVARTISDPDTRLADFIKAISRAATDTAATGSAAGEVWANADRTFAAFAAASEGIKQSIEESPETLAVLTEEFPKQRPFLRDATKMMIAFQPGSKYLPSVADDMAVVVTRGTPAMRHLGRTSPKFSSFFDKLGVFASDPQVQMGIEGLVTFVKVTNQPLSYITPSQTVCNYAGLFARNVASSLAPTGGDGTIGWLRFGIVAGLPNPTPTNGNHSQSGPGSAPSAVTLPPGTRDKPYDYQYSNPYPWTASPGQPDICAAGNEVSKGIKNPGVVTLDNKVTIKNPDGIKKGARTENTETVDKEATKRK